MARVAPSSPQLPPSEFGEYELGRELGSGAFSRVYTCQRDGSKETFAVKTISLRFLRLSTDFGRELKKLQREVDILKRIPPHPNVVRLVDALEEDRWLFLVLELVPGGDLFSALTSRPGPRPHLRELEVSFILSQLVNALSFLHAQGIVHRDLKLENVLVTSSKQEGTLIFYSIKITDFGLSKAVGEGLSEPHSMVGTRRYVAPEVLSRGTYDFRVDLWSLGVLLYLLLDGRYPHDLPAQAEQPTLDTAVARLQISEAARAVVAGLMRLEPARRLSLGELSRHSWVLDPRSIASSDVAGQDEFATMQSTESLFGSEAFDSPSRISPPLLAPGAPAPSLSIAPSVASELAPSAAAAVPALSFAPSVSSMVSGPGSPPQPPVLPAGDDISLTFVPSPVPMSDAMQNKPVPTPAKSQTPSPQSVNDGIVSPPMQTDHENTLQPDSMTPSMALDCAKLVERVSTHSTVADAFVADQPEKQIVASATTTGLAPHTRKVGKLAATPQCAAPIVKKSTTDAQHVQAGHDVTINYTHVRAASADPSEVQLHLVISNSLAGAILRKGGVQLKHVAVTAGCQVFMTAREGHADRHAVAIGHFEECLEAQRLICEQISEILQAQGDKLREVTVVFPVKRESAGSVIGKQGSILRHISDQSNARIQFSRQEVEGQRPCVIIGTPGNVLQAERLIFDSASASGGCDPVQHKHEPLNPVANPSLAKRCSDDTSVATPSAKRARPDEVNVPPKPVTKLLIPAEAAGVVIGKNGVGLKQLHQSHVVQVEVLRQADAPEWSEDRVMILKGPVASLHSAMDAVLRLTHPTTGAPSCLKMLVPSAHVGNVIGKQGSVLKEIRRQSGISVQVEREESAGAERLLTLTGEHVQVSAAVSAILKYLKY